MSGQHTPGPWTFSRCDEYRDVRFYISQADNAPYTPYYSDVATLVAETVRSDLAAIQEANARLIAAAPELLAYAECEAALELPTDEGYAVLERHGWNREMRFELPVSAFLHNMRTAAIRKATASTTDAGVAG